MLEGLVSGRRTLFACPANLKIERALDSAMRTGNQSTDQAFRIDLLPFYGSATAPTDMDSLELSLRGFSHKITGPTNF